MIEALRTAEDRRWYRLSLGALILAAWAALGAWGASPYAGLLGHGGAEGVAPLPRAVAFVAGWTLMTVAMMLPSSLPLVTLFRRFVLRREFIDVGFLLVIDHVLVGQLRLGQRRLVLGIGRRFGDLVIADDGQVSCA